MFSRRRLKRLDLIPMLAVVIALLFCCPILLAIDDEDNDLPDVILPNGGGGGGGGDGSNCLLQNPFNGPSIGNGMPRGFSNEVAVTVRAPRARYVEIPTTSGLAGLRFEPVGSSTLLSVYPSGGSGIPSNPMARIAITGSAGGDLDVAVGKSSCVFRGLFEASTTLEEVEDGFFRMEAAAGSTAVRGIACFVAGDLSGISADKLHIAVRNGLGECKVFRNNNGVLDVSGLLALAGEDLRNEVYDLGIVQVGLDGDDNIVSITNMIVTAYPFGGICNLEIQVFTAEL